MGKLLYKVCIACTLVVSCASVPNDLESGQELSKYMYADAQIYGYANIAANPAIVKTFLSAGGGIIDERLLGYIRAGAFSQNGRIRNTLLVHTIPNGLIRKDLASQGFQMMRKNAWIHPFLGEYVYMHSPHILERANGVALQGVSQRFMSEMQDGIVTIRYTSLPPVITNIPKMLHSIVEETIVHISEEGFITIAIYIEDSRVARSLAKILEILYQAGIELDTGQNRHVFDVLFAGKDKIILSNESISIEELGITFGDILKL